MQQRTVYAYRLVDPNSHRKSDWVFVNHFSENICIGIHTKEQYQQYENEACKLQKWATSFGLEVQSTFVEVEVPD